MEAVALARTTGLRPASEQLNVREETLSRWVKLVEDPVHCQVCGYATYNQDRLDKHMRKHNSGKKRNQEQKNLYKMILFDDLRAGH